MAFSINSLGISSLLPFKLMEPQNPSVETNLEIKPSIVPLHRFYLLSPSEISRKTMNLSVAANQSIETINKRLFWARMWGKSIEVPKQVVDLCSCAMAERGFVGCWWAGGKSGSTRGLAPAASITRFTATTSAELHFFFNITLAEQPGDSPLVLAA